VAWRQLTWKPDLSALSRISRFGGVEGSIENTQDRTAGFDLGSAMIPAYAERGIVETRMFWRVSDGPFNHERINPPSCRFPGLPEAIGIAG